MPTLDERLRLVRDLDPSARSAALAAALEYAGEDEIEPIARELLAAIEGIRSRSPLGGWCRLLRAGLSLLQPQDATDQAGRAIVRAWSRLARPTRTRAASALADRTERIVVELATETDPADQAAAAAAAADICTPATLASVERLLTGPAEPEPETAEVAAHTLLVVAHRARSLDAPTAAALDASLARIARRSADGGERRALRAVLAGLSRPGQDLKALLAEQDHPAHLLLRGAIRRWTELAARRLALIWLGFEATAPAALDLLCWARTSEEWSSAIAAGHLLLDPARRRRLARTGRAEELLPPSELAARLDARANRAVCYWLDALPIRPSVRAERLAGVAQTAEPVSRFAAAKRLAEAERPDATVHRANQPLTRDADPRVARTAALSLLERGTLTSPEDARHVAESPHESVRALGREALAEVDPLGEAPQPPWADLFTMRRWLSRDPEGCVADVRRRIARDSATQRLAAIRAAERLGLAERVELELLTAATDAHPKVAASAIKLLGRVPSGSAESAVLAALGHSDARVRANALEAMARRRPDDDRLRQRCEDDHPRSRANAIRGRLVFADQRSAETDLSGMLADPRPSHRVSALWVAERLRRPAWSHQVADLAQRDPEQAVRSRARRCARSLLATMRQDSAPVQALLEQDNAQRSAQPSEASA